MIPEKDIPRLVEWLMSRRKYSQPSRKHIRSVHSAFYWWGGGKLEGDRDLTYSLVAILTAAFKAFNERDQDDT